MLPTADMFSMPEPDGRVFHDLPLLGRYLQPPLGSKLPRIAAIQLLVVVDCLLPRGHSRARRQVVAAEIETPGGNLTIHAVLHDARQPEGFLYDSAQVVQLRDVNPLRWIGQPALLPRCLNLCLQLPEDPRVLDQIVEDEGHGCGGGIAAREDEQQGRGDQSW